MDAAPLHLRSVTDRMTSLWERGVRLARRVAIGFGVSTAAAIALGAAVTDNGFVQILVTVLAALGFWIPSVFLVVGVERLFKRRPSPRRPDAPQDLSSSGEAEDWQQRVGL